MVTSVESRAVPVRSGAHRPVRLRLLGPVGLRLDGEPITVGGPRAQAVLAVLATRAGEVVTADWLIDQLWNDRAPRAARVSVQSYVSRLRSIRPPATENLLPRHPRGYLLDPAHADVDVAQFVALSEQSRADARGSRWPQALEAVKSAARLWQGDPFTGIEDVDILTAERQRLVDLRAENRLTELQAQLEVSGPADVLGPLRELVETTRWDERGWRLLVLALYRAGRQTEALEILSRARRMLVEEQGLEPSPALGALEHAILVHDPALQPAPAPVTVRSTRPAPPSMVGRRRETDELSARWTSVINDGQSSLVIVEGEPGVGKSHLVSHLMHAVDATGANVLTGRCYDEPRLPLQPWSDLLPDLTQRVPDPAGQSREHAVIDVWELAAHRLFAAVTDRVRVALEPGPALLIVEDLHWAGVAALRLLGHVLTVTADRPLLVVATVRSTAGDMPAAAQGALAELSRHVRSRRIRLTGLCVTDLGTLLTDAGHGMDAAEVASVWERTGGVPLLALEAVRGGRDVLAARLALVSKAAVGVAELLAVAGDRYPTSVLGAASGLDEDSLGAALEELAGCGLVEPAPGRQICYQFTHALFRQALNTRLSGLRRVALSRRLLAAADRLPRQLLPAATAGYAVTVARSGLPTDLVRARDECRFAADGATAGHDHHEAATWLRRAVELAHQADADERTVAELETGYGLAARRAGLPDARRAFLRAARLARSAGDRELLARIGVGWSRGFFSRAGTVDGDFVAILREALHDPGRLPARLRARATAALAAELTWAPDGDERFDLADTALRLARTSGDAATLAEVLRTRHLTIAAADTLAVRRYDTTELLTLAEQLDDVGLRFEALFHRTGPAIADGDVELVERLLGAAGQIAETLRQPALEWNIGWSRASLLLWQGSMAAAEKLAMESADQGVAAGYADEAHAFLGAQLLEIRRLQGRLDELLPMLRMVPPRSPLSLTVARALCAAGHAAEAAPHLDGVRIEDGQLRLRRDLLERPSLDDLASLAAQLGRRDLAAAVRVRLEPHADTFGSTIVAHPIGHHWLGVLALAEGRPEDAVACLERAVARHKALDLPLMEAESHLALAGARDACGDRPGAAQARTAASEIAQRHGAAALLGEAL